MKLIALIFAISLVATCPSWAGDDRFLEIEENHDTLTYDINTVQLVAPGRFTIIHTTIDHPDVMKFELQVLATLKPYCTRADGNYPAPTDIFTLGVPDMPVDGIEVKTTHRVKMVSWNYPYKRLAMDIEHGLERFEFLHCNDPVKTEAESYFETLSFIMNGFRSKELFDCKRGQAGFFLSGNENDDPAKIMTFFVSPNVKMYRIYVMVCAWVTHEAPYTPE